MAPKRGAEPESLPPSPQHKFKIGRTDFGPRVCRGFIKLPGFYLRVVLGGLSWVRAAATNKALAVAYAAYVLPVIRGNTTSRRHRWQVR